MTPRLKNETSVLLTLAFIVAGSIFLRLYKIGDKPVWYDETVSISHAEKPLGFYLSSPQVNYKPVYFFLLNRWLRLFGEDAFRLRLFSAVWGVLNIVVLFMLARLLSGPGAGLLSAFLLGISVFHIFQCQQIRQFSWIALLATASVYYLAKFYKNGKTRDLGVLSVINILLIYTYPTGFFVVIAEGIFAAVYLRGNRLRPWLFSCVGPVLFAGLWFMITDKPHMKEMVWWIQKPGIGAIQETLQTLSWGGPRYGLDDFRISFPGSWLMPALSSIYLFLAALGAMALKREEKPGKVLLSLWLVVPVLAGFFISRAGDFSVYAIKHWIIVLPAFCALAALGLSRFNPGTRVVVLSSLCLLNVLPLSAMYNTHFSSDWKNSAEFVRRSVTPGDAVIVSSLSEVVTFMYYFDKKEKSLRDMDIYGKITRDNYKNNVFQGPEGVLIVGIKQTGFDDRSVSSIRDFENKVIRSGLLEGAGSVWVMLSRWTDPDVRPVIVSYLDAHRTRKDTREFPGVIVYHYEDKR